MKFFIQSETLLRYISGIDKAIGKNNILPVLDNFEFHIKNDALIISASDTVVFGSVKVDVEWEETSPSKDREKEVNFLVASDLLIETLKRLPKQKISFVIECKGDSVKTAIHIADGKYKMASKLSEGFPSLPVVAENHGQLAISSKTFKRAIDKTEFAIAANSPKIALNGLLIKSSAKRGFDFVATDAHKLVRFRYEDGALDFDREYILPKKTLGLLEGVYKTKLIDYAEEIVLKASETYCILKIGAYTIGCRLIDDTFPNYEAIIPKNNNNKLTIGRRLLYEALRRVELYANQATYQAKFSITSDYVILSAEDTDFNNEAYEKLPCTYQGEDLEIGFNAKYLIEILDKLDSEEIRVDLSSPNKAGLITPVYKEGEKSEESLLMLVMPITLNY